MRNSVFKQSANNFLFYFLITTQPHQKNKQKNKNKTTNPNEQHIMCQKHQLMSAYTSLTQTVYLSHILFISLKSFFFVPPFSFCTDGQIMVLTTISQVKTICRFPPTLYSFCSSHTVIWLSVPSAASISQPLVVTRTSWLESSTKKQKQHLGCFYKQIVGHELSP